MCVNVTQNPVVTPGSVHLPRPVTISISLQSPSPTTVTIQYSLKKAQIAFRENGSVKDTIERTVKVNGSQDVDVNTELVPRAGTGTGAHVIKVTILETGCGPKRRNAPVVGL